MANKYKLLVKVSRLHYMKELYSIFQSLTDVGTALWDFFLNRSIRTADIVSHYVCRRKKKVLTFHSVQPGVHLFSTNVLRIPNEIEQQNKKEQDI